MYMLKSAQCFRVEQKEGGSTHQTCENDWPISETKYIFSPIQPRDKYDSYIK